MRGQSLKHSSPLRLPILGLWVCVLGLSGMDFFFNDWQHRLLCYREGRVAVTRNVRWKIKVDKLFLRLQIYVGRSVLTPVLARDAGSSQEQAGTAWLIKKHICRHLLVDYCYYKSEILSLSYLLCYVVHCIVTFHSSPPPSPTRLSMRGWESQWEASVWGRAVWVM